MYFKTSHILSVTLFLLASFCSARSAPTERTESLLPTKCGLTDGDDKIHLGSPASIGAYPWMAAIGYTEPGNDKMDFDCAGSIINSKYVLTAAHCIDRKKHRRKRLSVIHLGDYNLTSEKDCHQTRLGSDCSPPHIVAGVEETVSHPLYNGQSNSPNDIALIRLNVTLDFKSGSALIGPVCLPPRDFNLKAFARNRNTVAAGWGLTEHGTKSDILLHANISIADDALCRETYKKNFVNNQLCMGGSSKRRDTCPGDSGGPLVISHEDGPPFIQVGIVSFGTFPCGLRQIPAVYTDLAKYRDWIVNNMKP